MALIIQPMIRAIVIEDQILVGVGLRNMFHPSRDGIAIKELYLSVKETILNACPDLFEIIILDLWLGESNPQENVQNLKNNFPGKPILIFTGEESPEWRRRMIRAGVNGYISKASTKCEIKTAILKLSNNQNYFPESTSNLYHEYSDIPAPIEFSIVLLLSEGYSLGEIAAKLRLSFSTIEKMLIKIRNDYHSTTNCELIKVFFEKLMIT